MTFSTTPGERILVTLIALGGLATLVAWRAAARALVLRRRQRPTRTTAAYRQSTARSLCRSLRPRPTAGAPAHARRSVPRSTSCTQHGGGCSAGVGYEQPYSVVGNALWMYERDTSSGGGGDLAISVYERE